MPSWVETDGAEFDWFDRALRIDLALEDATVAKRTLILPEGSVRVTR